jgi:hypothetical protein
MAYGILKCDTITFTSDGVDKSVAISGLVQNPTFTGNVTVTGTISGNTVRGQTISGVTVTGTTAQFTSGTFASLTGVTVTGTTANFTSGNFTNISGGTHTITSGVFASGTAANPSISFVSDPNSGLYSPGADQVAISTSGTGRLFINATGQVGIGGSPSSNFEITSALPTARLRDTTDNSYAEILNNNGALSLRADEGNVASASYIDIRVDGSERARFTSDGRLGLGTSSPATPIEVVGASTTDTEENYALFRGPGTAQPGVYIGGNSTTASTGATARYGYVRSQSLGGTARALYLQTGTDTRVVIDNTGKVGIGTTSPNENLSIAGTANVFCSLTSSGGIKNQINAADATGAGAIGTVTNHPLRLETNNTERARIDSSGRLLVGTSSARTDFQGGAHSAVLQVEVFSANAGNQGRFISQVLNSGANTFGPKYVFAKTRATSLGGATVVANGDELGGITFQGADGTNLIRAADINAFVDGTPGANDMPGRLVFSTTADGASSPTERFRITNDGVIAHDQPAPAAVNATATLTIANLKAGIITSTSALATDMTLPTGTDTQAGFSDTYDNFTFEWSVINTGLSLVRVLAGTAHTIVGSGSVVTGTSGRFASRRTAANTFVTYRLS